MMDSEKTSKEATGIRNAPEKLGLGGRLSFLAKDSMIYGGARALMQALSFITFPIMVRHFDVAQYGIIDFYGVSGELLAIFLAFSLDQGIARFFYDREHVDHRRNVITQGLLLNSVLIVPTVIGIFLLSGHLTDFVPDSPDTEMLITLTIWCAPFQVVVAQALAICKWTFARKRYLVLTLGSSVLRLGLLLLLILEFEVGVVGIFWMNLGISVVTAVTGVLFTFPWLRIPKQLNLIWKMASFTFPLWLITTMSSLGPFIERFITENLFGDTALGEYSAGAKVALLINLQLSAFMLAWDPIAYAIHRETNSSLTYSVVLKLFTLGAWTIALALGAFSPIILWVLAPPSYATGAIVTLPLAVGFTLMGIQRIINIGVTIKKRTYLRLPSFVAGIAIGFPAIYFLGREYGILGVALGAVVMKTIELLISIWINVKIYPIQWPVKQVAAGCIIGLLMGLFMGLSRFLLPNAWGHALACFWVMTFIVFGTLLVLNRNERRAIFDKAHMLIRISRPKSAP